MQHLRNRSKDSIDLQKVLDLLSKAISIGTSSTEAIKIQEGYSNAVYKVTHNSQIYKVRFGENNDLISRENEYKILSNLEKKPLYYDIFTGNSVSLWLPGNSLQKKTLNCLDLIRISDVISEYHKLPSSGILVHDDFEFLAKTEGKLPDAWINKYVEIVNKYKNETKVLCHNDISLSNILYDEKSDTFCLIDHEWGRVNNPCWDYGNFIKEANLSIGLVLWLSVKAGISVYKLYDFAFLASIYSFQLSYMFKNQTPGLKRYRKKLEKKIAFYFKWVSIE